MPHELAATILNREAAIAVRNGCFCAHTYLHRLLHIEDRLRQRVVGQDEALMLVANAVRRSRAGLGDPRRPMGSFLFI